MICNSLSNYVNKQLYFYFLTPFCPHNDEMNQRVPSTGTFVVIVQRCNYIQNALAIERNSLFDLYGVFGIYANLHSICVESIVQEILTQLSQQHRIGWISHFKPSWCYAQNYHLLYIAVLDSKFMFNTAQQKLGNVIANFWTPSLKFTDVVMNIQRIPQLN